MVSYHPPQMSRHCHSLPLDSLRRIEYFENPNRQNERRLTGNLGGKIGRDDFLCVAASLVDSFQHVMLATEVEQEQNLTHTGGLTGLHSPDSYY